MAWILKNTDFDPSELKYNEVIVKTWKLLAGDGLTGSCLGTIPDFVIYKRGTSLGCSDVITFCVAVVNTFLVLLWRSFPKTHLCLGNVSTASLEREKKKQKFKKKKNTNEWTRFTQPSFVMFCSNIHLRHTLVEVMSSLKLKEQT